KTHGRPVGTNHCKFLSSHPRVPDHGRDRALDGGRQEVQPLRPSGRDYDPDRLSPRLAGVRVVRSAMVAGRAGHWPATRPQGEERLAECPPDAGRRDTRAAASAARTGAVLARLYDRAGRADDAQGFPCAIRSDRGSGQDAVSLQAWLMILSHNANPAGYDFRKGQVRECRWDHSMQHCYATHWMNFHPLRVISIADVRPHDSDMRAHRRNNDWTLVVLACRLSIGLCWRYELADDLEDEISALVVHVSSIKQTLELWIDLQPAVSIPIGLMADAVRLTTVCCVNDSSRNGNARLLYDQSMRP